MMHHIQIGRVFLISQKKKLKYGSLLIGCLFILFLTGCSDTKKDDYQERSVEELYHEAYGFLHKENYTKAATTFEEIERQHPYSSWAPKSEILAAYSYYLAQKYDEAANLLETFIQIHPSYKDIAYVYYLLGLCYYEQMSGIERDQQMTELAFQTFDELIKRFPDSHYAKDAKLKLDLILDHLAGREMEIGRFYVSSHEPIAALNRFKRVVEKFQTTTHVPEALYRMIETYLILGIKEEAKHVAAVLGHNYPESIWYKDSYDLLTFTPPPSESS
ncbi:MAG: outer membrane protein assembly factor BamD [Proteobacteria bacterium]|nr:outer membrane protein assembly factor BamD [Pseudomonadota bacterium]